MERVTILWTGGWDSTFRLLQLCQYEVEIQPIYIIDRVRGSMEIEIRQMRKIAEIAKERFSAPILDIQFYEKEWILENCKDAEISAAFSYLSKTYSIGAQYEWFALLCKHLGNVKMESAILHHEPNPGKLETLMEQEGILSPIEHDFLPDRYCVLPKQDNKNAFLVFGNLILPVIKLTKADEQRIAEENDRIDIMKLSWFCHFPIKGEPCGICNPCRDAIAEGMDWRMPDSAKWRYKHKTFCGFVRKVNRKLKKMKRFCCSANHK